MKKLMKKRYPKPTFRYIDCEGFVKAGILLSNHEGTDAPMSLEIYGDVPIRMWGAHEMNSGLIKMYKYQTRVYYHEKKHWNLHLARLFCLLASPLTNLFYKGLNLISTYRDGRFLKTLRESVATIKAGQTVVIYPEVSDNGYLPQLEGFHEGFAMLGELCARNGIDVPVQVAYFNKATHTYIVDKPTYWSELKKTCSDRAEIAKKLLARCNEIGRMTFENEAEKEVAASE